MSYKKVLTNIDELRTLVAGWREGVKPAQIEMDMALDRVKSIYEMLRFPCEEVEEEIEEEVAVVAVPEVVLADVIEEVAPVAAEEVSEVAAEVESVVEEAIEEKIEEVAEKEPTQTELKTDDAAKRERLRKIYSLYEDDEPAQSEVEIVEEVVVAEAVVADVVAEEVPETVAEEVSETVVSEAVPAEATIEDEEVVKEVAEIVSPSVKLSFTPISSILGLNDRILLAQDLFEGDIDALTEALEMLDKQPTIDDAMIYIAENYRWSGDSEGAKLLVSLLQNRYL